MTTSSYQSFAEIHGDDNHVLIQVVPNEGKSGLHSWQHYTQDLDAFFSKIYKYHQKSGFACIVLSQIFDLLEIILVVFFTIFLFHGINYDVLFKNDLNNTSLYITDKVTIADTFKPLSEAKFNLFEIFLLIFAIIFWFIKLFNFISSVFVNIAIKAFYSEALHIKDVTQFSWIDIQTRLIQAQHLCLLQDGQLNELVIHNRIVRHHNYFIALINKGLLPIHYKVPIMGEIIFLTKGLQYNMQLLLFKGPFSLFEHNWKLREEIKVGSNRVICAEEFSKRCVWLALINISLFPLIIIYQILYTVFTYVEAIKRNPSMALGARNWTLYARWYCRHFNELDHQLNERLNRGYKATTKYMNSFTTPVLEITARFVQFVAGSIAGIILCLGVWDQDVFSVEHVVTLMAGLGAIIAISVSFISSEIPSRYTHAELNACVLEHIHYKPHGYAPYTPQARSAMSSVFHYKFTAVLEEIFSPLATPYILLRHLRPRALEIIDFFRNYTVEISGTGDICTFAMMNIKEHGNPCWKVNNMAHKSTKAIKVDEIVTEVPTSSQQFTQNGKLELSLIHFKLTNPNWNPYNESQKHFINNVNSSCIIKEEEERMDVLSSSRSRSSPNTANTPPPSNSSSSNNDDIESSAYKHERERIINSITNGISEDQEREAAMSLSTLFMHQYASNNILNIRQQNSESEPLL